MVYDFSGMPPLSSQQLVRQGLIHHLASPAGGDESEKFITESVINRYI
jgi:hypothetical protein